MEDVGGNRPLVAAWTPAAVVALGILVLSSIPGRWLPEPGLPHADKLVHFAVYGLLGLALVRAFARSTTWRPSCCVVGALALGVLWGAIDEGYQSFVPRRTPDLADLLADAIGVALAASMWYLLAVRRSAGGNNDQKL